MNVSDLYLIIRELQQINVLQSAMFDLTQHDQRDSPLHKEQTDAHERLKKLLQGYEKYDI